MSEEEYIITQIRTGKSFNGNTKAIITAPANANPGSLESITRFFNESGYKALPGYTGRDYYHVLRVRDIENEDILKKLIYEDFPNWQKQQNIDGKIYERNVTFSKDIEFEPVEASIDLNLAPIEKFVKNRSTNLTSLAYMVGDLSLIYSILFTSKGNPNAKTEWSKFIVPLCYGSSSILLFLLSLNKPESRNVRQIIDDIQPVISDGKYQDSSHLSDEEKNAQEGMIEHIIEFIQTHPWELSMIINVIGSSSHMYHAANQGKYMEAISAFTVLNAMVIGAFVPEKGGRSLFDFGRFFRRPDGSNMFDNFNSFLKEIDAIKPIYDAGVKMFDWVSESPLRTAAILQAASNVALFGAAVGNGKNIDIGLTGTSAAYFTGMGLQAISSKGVGPGFDDVVENAAAYINECTDWETVDKVELHKAINKFANVLSKQNEIVQRRQSLAEGIENRLERYNPNKVARKPEEYLHGFILNFESYPLRESPFISPRIVAHAIDEYKNQKNTETSIGI